MRFHVVSLPHTQTTSEYVHCAYTEKVRKFCNMMMSLDHEVFLYGSEDNEAQCTEFITCITKKEQKELIGIEKPTDNLKAKFDPEEEYWRLMSKRATKEIKKRAEKKDFLCLIAGYAQKSISEALPEMMAVEYGIGYGGVFSPYKVFESYAWMHTVYGAQNGSHEANGNYFDTVIPNYYETEKFPLAKQKDDYFLYIGRLIDRKGWRIAQEVCEKLGRRLIVAGQGDFSGYGEYVGVVNEKRRGELMSKAQAVFVPTQYIGPFEGVHAEALLCGTPVIVNDWGVFTETVKDGFNGYRCRSFQDFCQAAKDVIHLNPLNIQYDAQAKFSMNNIRIDYQDYFERLLTLWGDGWYAE